MVNIPRSVVEGVQSQGKNELRAYRVDTAPWGMTAALPPVSPTAKAYEHYSGIEVTDDLLTGLCVIESDTKIKAPAFGGATLQPGLLYRIEVQFTWQGNTLEYVIPVEVDQFG